MGQWKQVIHAADVVRNLIALRDELWSRCEVGELSMDEQVIYLKINSCLYSQYPVTKQARDKQDEYR